MDSKLDFGCVIQNGACGESGVIHCLKIVRVAEEDDQNTKLDEKGLLHFMSVFKYLGEPCKINEHNVCVDSYLASV
jgi:hypothetical protein